MYKVKIDTFEGPFDLLIYLLENAKMDIYDIRVSEITKQYIDYLEEMGDLDIEVGSEFIVLAAVLIKLKARMLLPRESANGEIMMEEDPRKELATRLAEYIRTKKIAELLQEREEAGLAIFEKPGEDISRYVDNPDEILKATEDQFAAAFFAFLERKKRLADVKKRYVSVSRERVSIEDRIDYMLKILDDKTAFSEMVTFKELIPENADKYDVALSFVSLLEMVRKQEIEVDQSELYGEIQVQKKNTDDRDDILKKLEDEVYTEEEGDGDVR